VLLMAAGAWAEPQEDVIENVNRGSQAAGTVNGAVIEEVVVIAHPLSGEGLSQAVDVLQGDELDRKVQANLGATLARQPGVHSAAFGAAVGRPVIHGLSGPRVRIMEDRIDTLDVSVTSGDHAVAVEPFIAERIEVLKGSSTLLYGSGAVGGVVDVHTGRIPHETPERIGGGVETRYNDNNHGQTTSMKLNGGSGRVAWHLDGVRKEGDDYKIPGFVRSSRLRSLTGSNATEPRGKLPGSAFDSSSGAVGAAFIDDWGFVGAAISRISADYGLPGSDDVAGNPVLELDQTRSDFELGIVNPFGAFTSFNLRFAANDYEHEEIEPSGEVATNFGNDAFEARMELVYASGSWQGAFGVQHADKRFSGVGEEAFIQPVDTVDSGVFWVGERSFESFDLETGVRVGRVAHDPMMSRSSSFSTYAISLGGVVPIGDAWQWALLADVASRAPVAEELYANGPHLVTGTFERGSESLDSERALNFSSTLQYADDIWRVTATAYLTRFTDFIYQQSTGEIIDDLPVVAYRQGDATFVGVDFEIAAKIADWNEGEATVKGMFDFVDAEVKTNGNRNLPRTPPDRYGIGLDVQWRALQFELNYMQISQQAEVAALEFASDSYQDLTAYLGLRLPLSTRGSFEIFLNGRNLTDDEQRIHTSLIKEVAPAPGRSVEAGVRVRF
jgi:iron complex outermembrane receptor protein